MIDLCGSEGGRSLLECTLSVRVISRYEKSEDKGKCHLDEMRQGQDTCKELTPEFLPYLNISFVCNVL